MRPPTRTRFASAVTLPYGMALEAARGQLDAAIKEAVAVAGNRGGMHMLSVAGVIRSLVVRIRELEGRS